MPDAVPVTPDEVPAAYVDVVARELEPWLSDYMLPDRDGIRRSLAAVLTAAREDIARAVRAETGCDDPRCEGCGWCASARVILAWPGEVLYERADG